MGTLLFDSFAMPPGHYDTFQRRSNFATARRQREALAVEPGEVLVPYRVRLEALPTDAEEMAPIVLERDRRTADRHGRDARSLDAIVPSEIPLDALRRNRADVHAIFPNAVRRMHQQGDAIETCVRDVQARRLERIWTVGGMDTTKNLSSLGMSVLAAILLSYYHGARVRVYVGRARAASHSGSTDPAAPLSCTILPRVRYNGFDVAPHLVGTSEAGRDVMIRKGSLVEVKDEDKVGTSPGDQCELERVRAYAQRHHWGKQSFLRTRDTMRPVARCEGSQIDLTFNNLLRKAQKTTSA